MDFTQRVVVDTNQVDWCPASTPGASHKAMAYEDSVSGHYTSMVRYRAGAMFTRQERSVGEEILVLAGTFSDETGDYPAGTYYRVPPSSGHMPFSQLGCVLLMKQHQFQAGDNESVCINTKTKEWISGHGDMNVMPLHDFQSEQTALIKWPAHQSFQPQRHLGGEEIFILSGELIDDRGRYSAGTWIRSPQKSMENPRTEQETVAFVKVGHLPLTG
ncbi:MAG: cupin domain-containing protein [Arenicella sp.]